MYPGETLAVPKNAPPAPPPDPYTGLPEATRQRIALRARGWWRFALGCFLVDFRARVREALPASLSSPAQLHRDGYIDVCKRLWRTQWGVLIVPPLRLPGFSVLVDEALAGSGSGSAWRWLCDVAAADVAAHAVVLGADMGEGSSSSGGSSGGSSGSMSPRGLEAARIKQWAIEAMAAPADLLAWREAAELMRSGP